MSVPATQPRPASSSDVEDAFTPPAHARVRSHFSSSTSGEHVPTHADPGCCVNSAATTMYSRTVAFSAHQCPAAFDSASDSPSLDPANQCAQPASFDFEEANALPDNAPQRSHVSGPTSAEEVVHFQCPNQTGADSPATTFIDSSQATTTAVSSDKVAHANLASPHASAPVTVAGWSALEDDPIQSFMSLGFVSTTEPRRH